MKISKMNWLLIAVIGVLTLCSSSCTKEDDSPTKKEDYESLIVGKWRQYRYVTYDKYGNVLRDKNTTEYMTITFQGDGTIIVQDPEYYIDSYAYEIFRNILTVTYEDGYKDECIIIKLTEEDLIIEYDEGYDQQYTQLYYGRVY